VFQHVGANDQVEVRRIETEPCGYVADDNLRTKALERTARRGGPSRGKLCTPKFFE
jgi:hypothetical protein